MLFKLYNNESLNIKLASSVMTKLMTTLTISVIASILVIGVVATAAPNAYSTWGGGDHHDDNCNYDEHGYDHYDDCDDDKPDDPCDCKKPDTLKFIFSTPPGEESTDFRIGVFKKLDDIDSPDKELTSINGVKHDEVIQLQSSMIGKDKLNSNTAFAIYKVVEGLDDELVASMEIHTSCSQPLYKGLIVSNNNYSLGVTDGLKNDKTSIPEFDPLICEDETKPKKIGSIVIRKAITNDNGGNAKATDFTITLTNVETNEEIILVHDQDDSMNPSVNVNEVPVGTYTISETYSDTVTGTYTTVLITGDTKCPAMVDESFTINKGKTLSCTIYNDDNGDGSGGPGGIVFRNFSMKVQLDAPMMNDSCDQFTNADDKDPCIQIVNFENGDIAIVDSSLVSTTTIVLFSVAQEQLDPMIGALEPDCSQDRIIRHDSTSDSLEDHNGEPIVNPSDNLVVLLQCPGMATDKVYNVNYVMINPLL